MSAPLGLGNYEAPSRQAGDSVEARSLVDHALIVVVHEKVWKDKTRHSPAGKYAIFLDVFDINTQEVYCGVMWMNGAVVDGLAPYANNGQAYPIMLQWTPNQSGGNAYLSPRPLEGENLNIAAQWVQARPNLFSDARQEKGYGPYEFEVPVNTAPPLNAMPVAAAPAGAPPVAPAPVAAPPAPPAPPVAPAPVAAAPAAPAAPAPVAAPPVAPAPVAAPPVAAAPAPVAAPPVAAPVAGTDLPF